MLLIEHRVNTVEKLRSVPTDRGVEIDIRDYDGALRCVHDPLLSGDRLDDVLANFRHALAIFNVKCDGLESQIERIAAKYGIENYFFLDVANPTLVQLIRRGQRRIAIRFSEYEAIEFTEAFQGKVEWIWIDCFTHLPLDAASYGRLKRNFKICLVSPELQRHPRSKIQEYRQQLQGMTIDAVCTDHCDDWM
jgi:hypothetical protein